MTTVKTVVTNYTADQVTAITAAYIKGDSLETIAANVGKSVPSVRAKLSQLKVYVSKAKKADNGISEKTPKENKDGLKSKLESLLGVELLNVESSSKQALLALINHINGLNAKIDSLIDDMLGDDSASDDSASDDSASDDSASDDSASE
jgi:hypothetical protein